MNQRGNILKGEKILLGLTAAFLCFLLALFCRDRAALTAAGTTVEAGVPVPQEAFLPDISPLNLNTASAEELTALPGIGEVLAERIVDYREEHGPFASEEELLNISGIGPAKLDGLEGRITVQAVPEE